MRCELWGVSRDPLPAGSSSTVRRLLNAEEFDLEDEV